jgi:hypothetical protein
MYNINDRCHLVKWYFSGLGDFQLSPVGSIIRSGEGHYLYPNAKNRGPTEFQLIPMIQDLLRKMNFQAASFRFVLSLGSSGQAIGDIKTAFVLPCGGLA